MDGGRRVAPVVKHTSVVVLWNHGLHLRSAAALVQVAKQFRSTLFLHYGGKIADLRSILSIVALCAAMGSKVDVEASGEDEMDAIQAIEQAFSSGIGECSDRHSGS